MINTQTEAALDEILVQNVLIELGVPVHLYGFRYLTKAIQIYTPGTRVTKTLYAEIAREFETTWGRVERAIRNAITILFNNGAVTRVYGFFGYTINAERGAPTNAQFIATVNLRMRQKQQERP